MKQCNKCKKWKDELDFRRWRRICKECENENKREYHKNPRAEETARSRVYRNKNKD
jgi:hypothetical protein